MRIRRNAGRTGSLLGLILLLSVVSLLSYTVPGNQGFAQSDQIPSWVKGIFALYAEDQIPDSTLINAIGYLVSVGIIPITEPAGAEFEDQGDFYVTYESNPNSIYTGDDTTENWLKGIELLEFEVAFLNENLRLPYDVEVIAQECDEINAFYSSDTRQITICYELVDDLFETYYYFSESENLDEEYVGDYANSVLDFIFFHEIGHALVDVYELPITGLEENAVDQFAALMLSYTYDESVSYGLGQEMLYDVGTWFDLEHKWIQISSEEGADMQYWDNHNLDIQRFYNIACYSYGADPEYNQDLIDEELLPEDRAVWCEDEYYQMEYGWSYLLSGFDNGFFDLGV